MIDAVPHEYEIFLVEHYNVDQRMAINMQYFNYYRVLSDPSGFISLGYEDTKFVPVGERTFVNGTQTYYGNDGSTVFGDSVPTSDELAIFNCSIDGSSYLLQPGSVTIDGVLAKTCLTRGDTVGLTVSFLFIFFVDNI